MMYQGWTLTLSLAPEPRDPHSYPGYLLYPGIRGRAHHARHGMYKLQQSVGKLFYPGSAVVYRSIQYQRWPSVIIETHPLGAQDTLLVCWISGQFSIDILDKLSPFHIRLEVIDCQKCDGAIVKPRPRQTMRLFEGIIQLILSPLGRIQQLLSNNRDLLQTPSKITAGLCTSTEVDRTPINTKDTVVTLNLLSDIPSESSRFQASQLETSGQQKYLDLCLDYILDLLSGWLPAEIREERWIFWDAEYEEAMISAASSLPQDTKIAFLQRLVERWTVWRAMDPQLRHLDWREWHDKKQLPPPDPSKTGQDRPSCSWSRRYECPRRAEYCFEQLKIIGLFYQRRVLVTLSGIFWDPDHLCSARHRPPRPRSDVLFHHDPPKMPDHRPTSSK